MLAFEALALFSTKTRRQGIDLQVVLSSTKNRDFRHEIQVDEQNALTQQHFDVSTCFSCWINIMLFAVALFYNMWKLE
jgi:hypothetical protein